MPPFAGAINNFNDSEGGLSVSGSTFTDNVATNGQGGAIYTTLGNSTGVRAVTDCVFIGNQATSGGGAIYDNPTYGGSGAGLVLTVSSSTFTSNEATGGSNGGALLNAGGIVSISGSQFTGNSATPGGALGNTGTLTVVDSTFEANQASHYGGAILNQGDLDLLASDFTGNTAALTGGGVSNGGAGNGSISGCTFTGNSQGPVRPKAGSRPDPPVSVTSVSVYGWSN